MKTAVSLDWRCWGYVPPGLFALLCCCVLACQPSATPAATTISDEKMARILADMDLAEAATARLNGYPKDSLRQVYFKQILEMHGATLADYEANLRVIVADQSRLDALLRASEDLLQEKMPPQ